MSPYTTTEARVVKKFKAFVWWRKKSLETIDDQHTYPIAHFLKHRFNNNIGC